MSFTNAEKVSIRSYMGWTNRYFQTQSLLEYAILAIETDSDATTLVRGFLTSLTTVDAEIIACHARMKVSKAGSITLPDQKELMALRSEGRRFVGRLSAILGVPVKHDVFSGKTPLTSNVLTVIH